jgi:Protein of unknown function (DUF3237)
MKPELQLLFEARGILDASVAVGDTPAGLKRVVPIVGGEFKGPRIRGTIVAGGADWQYVRADEVTVVEARYLLRTDDGVLIEVHNRGIRHGPPEIMQRLADGENVDAGEYYFRATPVLTAPYGKYEWLNRSLYVCSGARYATAITLWVYQIL